MVLPMRQTHGGYHPNQRDLPRRGERRRKEAGMPAERMEQMSGFTVKAVRWEGGWELHIADLGVTQVRTLAKAEEQAKDYVETLTGEDDVTVTISPDLGPLSAEVTDALKAGAAAGYAQRDAAAKRRQAVRDMRAAGVSVSDMATIMNVSRGRISQLIDH